MTVIEYLDFEVEIGIGQGLEYPLAVIRSPGGEARERMLFPFDELALASRLKDLQIALLRSSGGRRQILSPQERTVQEFGQKLFDALLSGEIRSRYDVSQREAAQRGLGLRLKLRIQPPELASLPWEFLYDPRRAEYICLSSQTPLVRYLELPQIIQPLRVAPPLRILGLIASPLGLARLDIENEKQRVETALADLIASGQVQINWLEHANRRELQRSMRRGPWHILHFIGHGGFDPASDEGFIALETERNELDRLPATQLARLLADHPSLRLAVLNSCEGAQGGNTDVFSSTASLLVRRGLPAVLAMQYEITDRAAIEFARGFYEALADGLPVDAATAEARKSVSLGLTNTIEWGTPVLFMRTPDGVLFEHLSSDEVARRAEREAAEQDRREKADHELSEKAYIEAVEKLTAEKAAREKAEQEVAEKARHERIIRVAQERAARELAEQDAAEKIVRTQLVSAIKQFTAKKVIQERTEQLAAEQVRQGQAAQELSEREAKEKAVHTQIVVAIRNYAAKTAAEERAAREKTAQAAAALSAALPKAEERSQGILTNKPRANENQHRDMLDLGGGVIMEFVRVPAGEFLMGSDKKLDKQVGDNELPQHKVYLNEYLIGKTPVTNHQYQVFVQTTQYCVPEHWKNGRYPSGKENHPVVNVSWQDAQAFCKWASQIAGEPVRLPSEAEWEKAARGQFSRDRGPSENNRLYPWGNQPPTPKLCNYDTGSTIFSIISSTKETSPVGKYSPQGDSPYGCVDLAGNVWEWTADWYADDYYKNSPAANPPGPTGGSSRVLRGGSWYDDPYSLRVSYRGESDPSNWNNYFGFRCVR